ncbi:hypothetical protein HJFPF1_05747 [Paramyrothecium foliicola]|nr:hypothetical protein HJFPF1_05747 [Paramyrothecium foliicola]
MMFSKPIAYASLASTASAWIEMTNPVPFTFDGAGLANMPLDSQGSNFPCQSVSYTTDHLNTYEAGSMQELNFAGAESAGGGSCQISLTKDLRPTKDSSWKVIKSFEGGCPVQNTSGNLELAGGDPYNQPVPFAYNFTVPDLQTGRYTLAWTWFNKLGNREMHMNCSPLQINGGAGSVTLDSLPDMFIANIDRGCTTTEGDLLFPNPGADVERLNGAISEWVTPTGDCVPVHSSLANESPAAGEMRVEIKRALTGTKKPKGKPKRPIDPNAGVPVEVPANVPVLSGTNEVLKYPVGAPCDTEPSFNCIDGSSYQSCENGAWTDVVPLGEIWVICAAGQASALSRFIPL